MATAHASVLILLSAFLTACISSATHRTPYAPSPAAPTTLGVSVQNRPIELLTHGSGGARVLVIALIHGNEAEGYEEFDLFWETLRGRGLDATIHAVPSMNPDGYALGRRGNASGIDLNRNWPASNFRASGSRGASPLSEPETRAVHAHIRSFRPDLVIVFHSTASGPFVDPDGPAGAHAEAFVAAARRFDSAWRVRADFTNPPGSLGSALGLDEGLPILTVEFRRGQDVTRARLAAEAGVVAAIHTATASK